MLERYVARFRFFFSECGIELIKFFFVLADKYCVLIEKEGGLDLLQEVIQHPAVPLKVRELANVVVENYKKFKQSSWPNEDFLLDG